MPGRARVSMPGVPSINRGQRAHTLILETRYIRNNCSLPLLIEGTPGIDTRALPGIAHLLP